MKHSLKRQGHQVPSGSAPGRPGDTEDGKEGARRPLSGTGFLAPVATCHREPPHLRGPLRGPQEAGQCLQNWGRPRFQTGSPPPPRPRARPWRLHVLSYAELTGARAAHVLSPAAGPSVHLERSGENRRQSYESY